MTKTSEAEFKKEHREDVCSTCPKRVPCATYESICELVTPCAVCEIRNTCTVLCDQMKGFLARGSQGNRDIPMSVLESKIKVNGDGDAESVVTYKYLKDKEADISVRGQEFSTKDIPWDAISDRDGKMVIEHFQLGRTYKEIAKKFNTTDNEVYTTIHGNGKTYRGVLAVLKEYAQARKILRENKEDIPEKYFSILSLYYVECKKPLDIAELEGVNIATVYRRLNNAKNFLETMRKTSNGVRYNGRDTVKVLLTQEEEFVAYIASKVYGHFGNDSRRAVKAAIEIVKETQEQMREPQTEGLEAEQIDDEDGVS